MNKYNFGKGVITFVNQTNGAMCSFDVIDFKVSFEAREIFERGYVYSNENFPSGIIEGVIENCESFEINPHKIDILGIDEATSELKQAIIDSPIGTLLNKCCDAGSYLIKKWRG